MYRRRTVEKLLHQADRREQDLQRQNRQLLDRLMYLIDRPWTPAPYEMIPGAEPEVLDPFELPDEMPVD